MKVAVVSDTHSPRFWKRMPEAVAAQLHDVDAILHAGDITTMGVLEELGEFAPVYAVRGNNDRGVEMAALPERLVLNLDGLDVALIHDAGSKIGRLARMRTMFPDAGLVVFGHSHIPLHETESGFHIFNPGSPTDKRRQPHRTMGLLDIEKGALVNARIVNVDQSSSLH